MVLTSKQAWEIFKIQRDSRTKDFYIRLQNTSKENYWKIDNLQRGLLKDCYQIPFFFTDMACSGQPRDHREKDYFSVSWAGGREPPQGYIVMSLFGEHPFAQSLHDAVSAVEGNAVQKSTNGSGNFSDHIFMSWNTFYVPEASISSREFNYLPSAWSRFHHVVREFILTNKDSPDWNWNP